MPVPTLLSELSTNPALNSPPGGEDVHPNLDNYLRQIFAFIAKQKDSLSVVGTANEVTVTTVTAGSPDVATVRLSMTLVVPGTAAYSTGEPIGFMNIEQEAISAAYTTVLGDANRSKVHPAADTTARAWVLGNLAYRMGAAITFINEVGAGAITLTAASGNFLLAGTGTVTTITIAAGGGCTVIRIPGANRWFISGAGITGA